MARICIHGIGYVGVVSAACLAKDGHDVVAIDVDPGKVDSINAGKAPIVENGLEELVKAGVESGRLRATLDIEDAINSTDISFVCVGTPSAPDGSVGLKYVTAVCEQIGSAIANKSTYHSVIIRSTIVPGSMNEVCIPALELASGMTAGKEFGVGYYPEFLRESTAIEDYYDPGLIVFGSMDKPTEAALYAVNDGLPCECHSVSISTAEMIKYTSNCWRAVKVSFANEIGNIAKASNVDGQEVMSILCSDTKVNISPYFMRPGFAFGGSCLPKDVRALRHLAGTKDVPSPMLDAVLEANKYQIEKAETLVDGLDGKKVGMVGVSFKPGTDDLRESPLAELAARLISKGYDVNIYDPNVSTAFGEEMSAAGRGNDVVPDLQARLVPAISTLIDDSEILLVGNKYDEAIEPLIEASETLPMLDLMRVKPNKNSQGSYEGICW